MAIVNNFVVIDSIHGKFIVNRHCSFQAEALIKTGATHIEAELKNMLTVIGTLPEGSFVLDAGANIGMVSVPIANTLKAKGGTVWAFEIQRMLCNALCGTVALNDLENLFVFNQGLGQVSGSIRVPEQNYSKPFDFGTVSLEGQPLEVAVYDSSNVPIVRMDDLNLDRLDFLKIDVEGMELDVLKGGENTIKKYRPWCWVEYWKSDREGLKSFFSDLGYVIYTMDSLNILCAPQEKLHESSLVIEAPLFK